jgi:hypothetical protein
MKLRTRPNHRCSASIPTLLALAAAVIAAQPVPPLSNWASDHPEYADFKALLARHATRAEIRASLLKDHYHPRDVRSKAQLLAIPPSMPPSKRAFILLEHWPRGLYCQLIDDLRVLACFDSHDRLVAYEFF